VSDGYFATLGTAIVSGRDISVEDVQQGRRVAVINEALAKRFFSSPSPLGKTFRMLEGDTLTTPREVIGVVRDTKYQRLDEQPKAIAYIPLGQGGFPSSALVYSVRTTGAASALIPAVRSAAIAANPAISLSLHTLESQVAGSLARPRLLASLSVFFGALALLLAVIGLYGTMSYNVMRRRNEIGIRMALGAAKGQVLRMVVGESGRLILLGLVVGAFFAIAGTRLLTTFLFGITATDPRIFALSMLTLAVTALAAAALPAWRASRLDPMEALREE
jgi:putative ABC transport system permease protein